MVAIGSPDGGKTLCQKLEFPEDKFYVDDASRQLYAALKLNYGPQYFWSQATKDGVDSIKDDMPGILAKYSPIMPPSIESTLQLGGVFVMDGSKLFYAHIDEGLGAHAPNNKILEACGAPV